MFTYVRKSAPHQPLSDVVRTTMNTYRESINTDPAGKGISGDRLDPNSADLVLRGQSLRVEARAGQKIDEAV